VSDLGISLRRHAKNANFGMAPTISLAGAELMLMLAQIISEQHHRHLYAEERNCAEWIDVGGEA
jgi:hypothetical protein